mmetsp:Transcript_5279/g.5698  ORF Transcript_5279/g.5698 Transcript_5279/m.5698 type:complete len:86 (+) Transcript_5279:226-483(+)
MGLNFAAMYDGASLPLGLDSRGDRSFICAVAAAKYAELLLLWNCIASAITAAASGVLGNTPFIRSRRINAFRKHNAGTDDDERIW